MTDEYLLKLIRDGLLRVEEFPDGVVRVYYFHRRRRRWYEKKEDYHPRSGRARFRFDTPTVKRSTVYKNRLVYVAFNNRVPQGYVDHKDHDRRNDRPDNLRDQLPDDSNAQGRRLSEQIGIERAGNWFDFVARYGTVPPDGWETDIQV